MSMLSSMCDKLRTTADEVERIKHNNADWLWRDGVTLMDAVRELRDAADVINSLRTTCQDLQFENEKLKAGGEKLDEETGRMFAVQLTEDAARRHLGKVNSPVYDMNGMLIGWLGDRLPDRGFPCEYAELAGDGALVCDELMRANRLSYENEQLRKVADLCSEYISEDRCEGCFVKLSCNVYSNDCWMRVRLINMMHDLGIEVDDNNQNNFQSTKNLVDLNEVREVDE